MGISEKTDLVTELLSCDSSTIKEALNDGYGAATTAIGRKNRTPKELRRLQDTEDWGVLLREIACRDAEAAYKGGGPKARAFSVAERIAYAIGWRIRSAEEQNKGSS